MNLAHVSSAAVSTGLYLYLKAITYLSSFIRHRSLVKLVMHIKRRPNFGFVSVWGGKGNRISASSFGFRPMNRKPVTAAVFTAAYLHLLTLPNPKRCPTYKME